LQTNGGFQICFDLWSFSTHFIKRLRNCTKFSGCTEWGVESDDQMTRLMPLNNDAKLKKTEVVMQVRGPELYYSIIFNDQFCPGDRNR
jgi:hypothetical protein